MNPPREGPFLGAFSPPHLPDFFGGKGALLAVVSLFMRTDDLFLIVSGSCGYLKICKLVFFTVFEQFIKVHTFACFVNREGKLSY